MVFAHDTEVALQAAAALVNTAHDDEQLATVADLDAFVTAWGWTGARRRTGAELDAVKRLRPRLERFWYVDEDGAARIVNELLHEGRALPQLVKHDGWGYHVHATSPEAPLADRMAVEGAMAMADVIRMDDIDRLQVCAAEDCADVMVDVSKNRSRRFCSLRCSNRTNVAAFRARRRDARR
ncbi:MAG: CGNR zinc finger domain-containing protein [bacterium]